MVLLIGFCALLGIIIGSFLNVVIYRVPRSLSVVTPRSSCPKCGTAIQERDNIPIVSWIVLRGRCRNCNESISVRYPLVELASSILFALAAGRFGFNWDLPAYLTFFAGILALALIDLEHLVLPKKIVYTTIAVELSFFILSSGLGSNWHHLLIGVICAIGWFVIFLAINVISPRAMGLGDVRLAPALGLALGWLGVWTAFLGFFMANFIGALVGVLLIATGRMKRNQQIPYGVFLAIGSAAAIFVGNPVILFFQNHFG